MAGLRSRTGRWRASKPRATTPVAPYVDRPTLRVSNLYGTAWRAPHDDYLDTLTAALSFGRLESFYKASVDQLPAVIATRQVEASTVRCRRWGQRTVASGRLWLFVTPSDQVVVGLTLDVACEHHEVINLLEDCYYLDVTVEGTDITAMAVELASAHGVKIESREFAPERHQVVYSSALRARNSEDLVQRLIYRADLPYRPEFATIAYPGELNRRPNTTGAVGPYVSVLCGHQDYVENATFLSAVQAVASSVRLREIRNALYQDLREFNVVERQQGDTRSRRRALEKITDDLTRLELDLSVSVEAPADLGVLVPSLRIIEYHTQVYSSIGIKQLAETVSRMLRRLEATGRAELTSVESIERRADEDRRLRWAIGVGFVSVVAIPISLLLAFFGINASQVDPRRSMFDAAYLWVYAGVGLLAVVAAGLAVTLYVLQTRNHKRHVREKARSPVPAEETRVGSD